MLLIAGLGALTCVHAEKADATKPTNVEADQMQYDDVKQINTFVGNVVLTRGSILMKSNKMVVTQDPAGYQFVVMYAAPGSLASFRQKRDGGPDQWIEGQAERIEYDDKNEIMKLGLQDDFVLLRALQDPLGDEFNKLGLDGPESPLASRNQSILAHGFSPVSEKTCKNLDTKLRSLLGFCEIPLDRIPRFPQL